MTIQLADLVFEPFIDAAAIRARVEKIGSEISSDYAGKKPLILSVLNGSFLFMADLVRAISIDCEMAFVRLSSYHGETETSGNVRELIGLEAEISGRDVIIVEDIVDTGITLQHLVEKIRVKKPASVRVCSLLVKRAAMQHQFDELRYVAFEIDPVFVVGYGLDYRELGRNLPEIYQLKKTNSA